MLANQKKIEKNDSSATIGGKKAIIEDNSIMRQEEPIEPTRQTLILKIRDPRDQRAWSEFVAVYTPMIVRYCRYHRLQDADVADTVQDVLSILYKQVSTYDPNRGRFRWWLKTIVDRAAIRTSGKKNGRLPIDEKVTADVANVPSKDDAAWLEIHAQEIGAAALARVRNEFDSRDMAIFEKLWFDGQPPDAVSQEFEVPIEKVYRTKSKILRRLRENCIDLAGDFFGP